jgi:hypothetical protein
VTTEWIHLIENPRLKAAAKLVAGSALVGTRLKAEKDKRWPSYSITIAEGDEVYADMARWVLDRTPNTRRNSLTVESRRKRADIEDEYDRPTIGYELIQKFDGSQPTSFMFEGHRISASVVLPENVRSDMSFRLRLVLSSRSVAGRDAVLRTVQELVDKKNKRTPRLYMPTKYNGWTNRSDLSLRPIESVILKKGQRESVVQDFERFLAAEEDYKRLGIPWYRGYLFEGPPGSGKSSLARGLASHFNLDIYYLPLSDLKKDQSLLELVGTVQPRSILLIEDVDTLHSATSRDDDAEHVSMSGLLNSLDGIATPAGLVKVLSTNDVDRLDPALIRKGRIDRIERIDYLDQDQAERLVEMILRRWIELPTVPERLTAADVLEAAKHHLDNPDGLEAAIRDVFE